ncbi:plasma-membrane choline transporter-domain-containing protein [Dipodascopsis uninucleata]
MSGQGYSNQEGYTGEIPPSYPPPAHENQYSQQVPEYQPDYSSNYQQQQNYAPPVNNYSKPGNDEKRPQNGPTFEDEFKVEKPKWNDVWATILFLAVLAGFIVVSGISLNAYRGTKDFNGNGIYGSTQTFSLNTNTVVLFAFVIVISLVISVLYFWLARMFTKQFIWITGIINVILGFATAIYYFAEHYYSAAIVFLLFALFGAYCFISWRSRIPFATLVLQTIMDVTKSHPSVLVTSLLGTIVASAFGAWFALTIVAVYMKYNPTDGNEGCNSSGGGCSHAKLIGILIYVTFCGYYISEVIKNVIHTTVSGVYGTWYFCSRSAQGMPRWPALGAFKRSMTYSFGSISFGSLIVSIVQLLQQLASWGQQAAQQDGNTMAMVLFCVLRCFIGVLNWAVQYFNHYAYCYIALYGSAYLPAAKETWNLIKDRGIDALINDCLIDPVLNLGSTFVAYVAALFAYLYLKYTNPAYNSSGNYNAPVIGFTFVIALQICHIATVPIKSGTATFFTALARDPEVFRMSYPELYDQLLRSYPKVRERIHA